MITIGSLHLTPPSADLLTSNALFPKPPVLPSGGLMSNAKVIWCRVPSGPNDNPGSRPPCPTSPLSSRQLPELVRLPRFRLRPMNSRLHYLCWHRLTKGLAATPRLIVRFQRIDIDPRLGLAVDEIGAFRKS